MTEEETQAIGVIDRAIARRILPPLGEEPMDIMVGSVAYALLDQVRKLLGVSK